LVVNQNKIIYFTHLLVVFHILIFPSFHTKYLVFTFKVCVGSLYTQFSHFPYTPPLLLNTEMSKKSFKDNMPTFYKSIKESVDREDYKKYYKIVLDKLQGSNEKDVIHALNGDYTKESIPAVEIRDQLKRWFRIQAPKKLCTEYALKTNARPKGSQLSITTKKLDDHQTLQCIDTVVWQVQESNGLVKGMGTMPMRWQLRLYVPLLSGDVLGIPFGDLYGTPIMLYRCVTNQNYQSATQPYSYLENIKPAVHSYLYSYIMDDDPEYEDNCNKEGRLQIQVGVYLKPLKSIWGISTPETVYTVHVPASVSTEFFLVGAHTILIIGRSGKGETAVFSLNIEGLIGHGVQHCQWTKLLICDKGETLRFRKNGDIEQFKIYHDQFCSMALFGQRFRGTVTPYEAGLPIIHNGRVPDDLEDQFKYHLNQQIKPS
jgi:hypothetical protein